MNVALPGEWKLQTIGLLLFVGALAWYVPVLTALIAVFGLFDKAVRSTALLVLLFVALLQGLRFLI